MNDVFMNQKRETFVKQLTQNALVSSKLASRNTQFDLAFPIYF